MAENVQTQINDAQYMKDLKAAIELVAKKKFARAASFKTKRKDLFFIKTTPYLKLVKCIGSHKFV